jgi:hypothetical protein
MTLFTSPVLRGRPGGGRPQSLRMGFQIMI